MIMYLAVALGGALGTIGRYFVSGLVANAFGETFPWGTLIINITGSFVIGFFEQHKTVGAWCELRQDFRHFRIDRIASLAATGERSPKRRHALVKEWREKMAADAEAYRSNAAARN